MTEKRFWRLIALAAALGLGVCAALAAWPGLIELPFKLPCGYFVDLLWDISKTGAVWRILAIILYVLVCLVPAGALFLISRRRRPWREDWLLALLSVVLLLLVGRALDRNRTIYSAFAQMGLLAVLVTWLALRLLRYFSVSDDRRLVRLVRIVVVLIGMLFAALAGVSAFAILASLFERFTIPALAEGAGSVASSGITVYGCLLGLRLVDSLGEGGELTDDTVELAVTGVEDVAGTCGVPRTVAPVKCGEDAQDVVGDRALFGGIGIAITLSPDKVHQAFGTLEQDMEVEFRVFLVADEIGGHVEQLADVPVEGESPE